MNKQTVVASYIRGNKYQSNIESTDNTIGFVIGGSMIILFALVYIQTTIVLGLFLGAAYGVKTLAAQNLRSTAIEAVTAPQNVPQDKPKRSYKHRLTVNHFQTKSVRI